MIGSTPASNFKALTEFRTKKTVLKANGRILHSLVKKKVIAASFTSQQQILDSMPELSIEGPGLALRDIPPPHPPSLQQDEYIKKPFSTKSFVNFFIWLDKKT